MSMLLYQITFGAINNRKLFVFFAQLTLYLFMTLKSVCVCVCVCIYIYIYIYITYSPVTLLGTSAW